MLFARCYPSVFMAVGLMKMVIKRFSQILLPNTSLQKRSRSISNWSMSRVKLLEFQMEADLRVSKHGSTNFPNVNLLYGLGCRIIQSVCFIVNKVIFPFLQC